MLHNKFIITGTLLAEALEMKGAAANFPVLNGSISTGEKFYTFSQVGNDAQLFDELFSAINLGDRIRVGLKLVGRRSSNGGAFTDFQLESLAPDFTGANTAGGLLTGIVGLIKEREWQGKTIYTPTLYVLLADRDGIIPDAAVEIVVPFEGRDAAIAEWKQNEGRYAEVQVNLDARITEAGKSYPQFKATKISFYDAPAGFAEIIGQSGPAQSEYDDAI